LGGGEKGKQQVKVMKKTTGKKSSRINPKKVLNHDRKGAQRAGVVPPERGKGGKVVVQGGADRRGGEGRGPNRAGREGEKKK